MTKPSNRLVDYFAAVSSEMAHKASRIGNSFTEHHPTIGQGREEVVAEFLSHHLPSRLGVKAGLVLDINGALSAQADVVIYDRLNSMPLHSQESSSLFLVESVAALLEVKSHLSPTDLNDSIQKCRRFKRMRREFDPLVQGPRLQDSLFVIWTFGGPSPTTLGKNYDAAIAEVPIEERPDFILQLGSCLMTSGQYLDVAQLGQPHSEYRKQLVAEGRDLNTERGGDARLYVTKQDALFMLLTWMSAWLVAAVPRAPQIHRYIPDGYKLGDP